MTFFLALDQGTSSSRALLFDHGGQVRALAQTPLAVRYPQPGWVEQDAAALWASQHAAAQAALDQAGVGAADVAAIGLANQRETTIVWERASGRPIGPAIVWQDRRTAARCQALRTPANETLLRARTGLRLDPYFSATKIGWILDRVEGARARAARGELAFGTVDCWLLWNLTGGRLHATDVTNAARTALFNIDTGTWDPDLLALFEVPAALLPEVRPSAAHFGRTTLGGGQIALIGVAGDQPAALLGQGCQHTGQAKNTYGTGAFVVLHTGAHRHDVPGLISGPVCALPGQAPQYGLEGSIFVAGALVQWLRDGLGLIEQAADIEALARQVEGSDGVCIVPAFTGLGAPYWDPAARGAILGLTRGSRAAHLARAALEAIALRTCDVVRVMQAALDAPIPALRVDGGAAGNDLLLQLQADLLGLPVLRPRSVETTAAGAAMLAAVGSEALDAKALSAWHQTEREFAPALAAAPREARYRRWQRACLHARGWVAEDST